MIIRDSKKSDQSTPRDDNRPYFHELSQEQIDKLVADKNSWSDIMREYKQPAWCNYPKALDGLMGCWSLIDLEKDGWRTKISNEYCKTCDYHKEFKTSTKL